MFFAETSWIIKLFCSWLWNKCGGGCPGIKADLKTALLLFALCPKLPKPPD